MTACTLCNGQRPFKCDVEASVIIVVRISVEAVITVITILIRFGIAASVVRTAPHNSKLGAGIDTLLDCLGTSLNTLILDEVDGYEQVFPPVPPLMLMAAPVIVFAQADSSKPLQNHQSSQA